MTALTPQQKERLRGANARASKIRTGITTYLETLAAISTAYEQRDWETLGYDSWQEYIDGEYSADRLRIAFAYRQKAIEDLRLAGLSTRAIAPVVGVHHSTVARQVSQDATPEPVQGVDGKTYSPARSPLVEAMTGAIEDADRRNETAPTTDLPAGAPTGVSRETGEAGRSSQDEVPASPTTDPGVAAPAEEVDAPAASSPTSSGSEPAVPPAVGEGEQGGPATSPAGPSCEKCGTGIDDDGYRRCAGCDPDGMHAAADDGSCRLCALLATVPDEYLPIQVGEGVHGLQLECGCGAVVSHLKAGMPLGVALVEAYVHHGACQ